MRLSPALLLMLILPPLMWAGNAVVGRMAVSSIDPLWLNSLRWLLAFLFLLPLGRAALATPAARAQVRARWQYLAVLGLLGIGIYNALQYLALRTSSPVNVTLIASSLPVWTLLIGALAYRLHPTRLQLIGAVLSLAGVATVLSRGSPAALLDIQFVAGDLLMLLAIMCWSMYSWLLARPPANMRGDQRPTWDWVEFLLVQCLFGIGWTLLSVGVAEAVRPAQSAQWSWSLTLTIVFVAVGPSIIAFRSWGLAVAQAGPAVAAVFNNLTPLFTAVLSAAVIGEWPQGYHGVAFALILIGILVSTHSMRMGAR